MSRNKGDRVTERPEILSNARDEGRVIAAGEVGATNRPLEQYVANEGDLQAAMKEHDMSGRVPGTVQHLEFLFANHHPVPV